MHKQHGGLWKSVQKLTLLAADEHCWLIGENTEKDFVAVVLLNTWALGVSTFGFVAVGRQEASMHRTNVGFLQVGI